MKFRIFLLIISFSLFLSGCAVFRDVTKSMDDPYKVGAILESYKGIYRGSNSDKIYFNSELVVKKDIKGKVWAELSSSAIYSGIIKGELSGDAQNGYSLIISSINYSGNWANGWTVGESETSGEIVFSQNGKGFTTVVKEPLEVWDIIKGGVRRYDKYFLYEEGTKRTNYRVERIRAVNDFLKKQEFVKFPEYFLDPVFNKNNKLSFKKEVQTFLFPETLGIELLYKNKKLPEVYQFDKKLKDDISIAEGYFWRKSYTKAIFPENMKEVRNTGSLWQDFEEAPGIFVVFYNIDYYFSKILPETVWERTFSTKHK